MLSNLGSRHPLFRFKPDAGTRQNPVRIVSRPPPLTRAGTGVQSRYLCPTSASVPLSHYPARPRYLCRSGLGVIDVAMRYGVDRRTVQRWIARYMEQGLVSLADKSPKPVHCPHQMPSAVEERIVEMRRAHPDWGPRTILSKLKKQLENPPSRAAIHRCLVRNRLVDHKPRKRKREDYKRWERSRPMELWQMDVMAVSSLVKGMHLQLVTGVDDHSRFCVIGKLLPRATAKPICDAMLEALGRYGIPEQILIDNDKVFTGKRQKKPMNVLFDRICLNNGIKHILTAPYHRPRPGRSKGCTERSVESSWLERSSRTSIKLRRLWTTGSTPTTTKGIISHSVTPHPSVASSSKQIRTFK